MRCWIICGINGLLFVLVMVAVPSVASLRIGDLRLSSRHVWQELTVAGLALVAALNGVWAAFVARSRRERRLCYRWMLGCALLLIFEVMAFEKVIEFGWFKRVLIWLRDRAG